MENIMEETNKVQFKSLNIGEEFYFNYYRYIKMGDDRAKGRLNDVVSIWWTFGENDLVVRA